MRIVTSSQSIFHIKTCRAEDTEEMQPSGAHIFYKYKYYFNKHSEKYGLITNLGH